MAAHLIIRERELWTGPGLVRGGPFAELTARRRAAWQARGREALIGALRAGPPWPLTVAPPGGHADRGGLDPRAGRAPWRRRLSTPPPRRTAARGLLWGAAQRFAARTLSLDADVVIELTDGRRRHRMRSRRTVPFATPTEAPPDVTVNGRAAELRLSVVGRDGAEVDVTGDAAAESLLAACSRSI